MADKREMIWILCLFALLILPSVLTQISLYSFNNTLTAENLTFIGNENITRYLTISRYANVTGAYMNLSGNKTYLCHQETANISYSCGGLNTGNYVFTSEWQNPEELYDGIYYNLPAGGALPYNKKGNFTINYTKPINAIKGNFTFAFDSSSPAENVTIPISCWNAFNNVISFRLEAEHYFMEAEYYYFWAYCKNNTAWENITIQHSYASATRYRVEEESITWYLNNSLSNSSIEVGSVDGITEWYYNGTLNQENNKTQDFSSSINSALASGECNCSGCSLIDNDMNCSIPFLFHSDSIGILGYSAINISYINRPYFNSNQSIPSYSALNGNVKLQVNITDLDAGDTISYCNFTALSPSNKYAIDNVNGTSILVGTDYIYNSSMLTSNVSGIYVWNATCKSSDGFFARASGDFSSNDLTSPSVQLTAPLNGTYATASVPINKIVSDDVALSSCWYNLNGAGNTSLSLTSNTTLSLTNNDYFLILYCQDSSMNQNSTNVSFVVYVPPVTSPAQTGGASEEEAKCQVSPKWFVDRRVFDNLIPYQGSRSRNFCIYNNGTEAYHIILICDDTSVNTTSNICKNVDADRVEIDLQPNLQQEECVFFTTSHPDGAEMGDSFFYGIVLKDGDGCEKTISVSNKVSAFWSLFAKPFQSTSVNEMFGETFGVEDAGKARTMSIPIIAFDGVILLVFILLGILFGYTLTDRHLLLQLFILAGIVLSGLLNIYI